MAINILSGSQVPQMQSHDWEGHLLEFGNYIVKYFSGRGGLS